MGSNSLDILDGVFLEAITRSLLFICLGQRVNLLEVEVMETPRG